MDRRLNDLLISVTRVGQTLERILGIMGDGADQNQGVGIAHRNPRCSVRLTPHSIEGREPNKRFRSRSYR